MNHLFLEGPIQTGKSTLIREALRPYMDSQTAFSCKSSPDSKGKSFLGGFASQRLTVPVQINRPDGSEITEKVTKAFRIGPAATTPLTAPLHNWVSEGPDGPIIKPDSSIFKCFGTGSSSETRINLVSPDTIFLNNRVFNVEGVRYLRDTDGRRLMLLDEIGGQELTNEDFMAALYELLAGPLPCIGVIKHPANTGCMDKSLIPSNEELHEKITTEYDGEILYYERGDEAVRRKVDRFLSHILNHPTADSCLP